ncbi:MAG: DNA polymerase III subunit delta [Bacteroidetes bacterium]|nr:DNA polymerase III subunit delta [Bacteroidota bacterium]MCB0842061.1 DNA polymerase III subunit delta [Bacteroidota bacterium]
MNFNQIIQEIKSQKFSPVYYLYGEEEYFIDKISEALNADGAVLTASETAFNREVFYGPETQASKVINACRSFPVMAARRLVVLKEAQRMNKTEVEKLASYLQQPVPSTVLVLVFKGKNAGLNKAGTKAAEKAGVVFHAKKMYDQDVQQWVNQHLTDSGFEFDNGIPGVLVANLGTNINLIENELEKMFIFLRATKQTKLNLEFVYQMINVDKEFNVFELINALGKRDQFRSHMIIDRLSQNSKINPPVLTVGNLFRFFHNLALIKRFQLKDPNSVKHKLGVNYYAAKDYLTASQKFDLGKIYRNIGYIHDADLQLKGMIPSNLEDAHVLKTLVWKLLNA